MSFVPPPRRACGTVRRRSPTACSGRPWPTCFADASRCVYPFDPLNPCTCGDSCRCIVTRSVQPIVPDGIALIRPIGCSSRSVNSRGCILPLFPLFSAKLSPAFDRTQIPHCLNPRWLDVSRTQVMKEILGMSSPFQPPSTALISHLQGNLPAIALFASNFRCVARSTLTVAVLSARHGKDPPESK